MIFIQGYGNKNYSKLNEVMHLDNKKKQENQEGYEKLTQVVDENYRTFSSNMNYQRMKHNKMNMKMTTSSFKPSLNENLSVKTTKDNGFHIMSQTANTFEVKENSLEAKFISKFKRAVKINSSELLNFDKFNKIVNENIHFHHKNTKSKIDKLNKKKQKENIVQEKENTLQMANEKSEDDEKEKKESDISKLKEEQSLIKEKSIIANESIKKPDIIIARTLQERKIYLYKLQRILTNALTYLYENNIPIRFYLIIHPFPKTPLSKAKSKEFFEEVKLGNDKRVRELLMLDKYLIFEYDHFKQTGYHWAAKRGLKSTLELLISFGNHLNLYDLNWRTPLFLAALNNHYEVCKFLLDRGANPFLKSSSGKKPIDVCTDDSIKRVLKVNMDNINIINKWTDVMNYHKTVKDLDNNMKIQETTDYI